MITRKYLEGGVVYEWALSPGMISVLERNTFIFESHDSGVRFYIHPNAMFGEPRKDQFVTHGNPYDYYLSLGIPLPEFPRTTDEEEMNRFKNQVNENLRAVLRNREVPLVFGSRNIGTVILRLEEDMVPA